LSKSPKLTVEEVAEEERRTTAIGLCLQAESFLKAAEFTWKANESGELIIRFNDPAVFLLSHGIELTLKAWLRTEGYSLAKLISFRHNLTRLYKECKRVSLPIDEKNLVSQWAARSSELHFSENDDLVSESERVARISATRRGREVWRNIWLLGKLHNSPYILRYHRSGYYRYPGVEFLLMCALYLNSAIQPKCNAHYNASKIDG
jgi:hypothetical protein